jgi:hypothetical protein
MYAVPSQASIYQHLIAQDANFHATNTPTSVVAIFLNEGIKIQEIQYVFVQWLIAPVY